MSYTTLLLSLLSLPLLYFLYILTHAHYLSPLRTLPSIHPLARLTPHYISRQRRNSLAIRPLLHAHRTHGPIILLSPTEVSVASYSAAHTVYIAAGGFAKPKWWAEELETFGVVNMVGMVGGKGSREHAGRRRDVGGVYGKTGVLGSEEFMRIAGIVVEGVVGEVERVVEGQEGGEVDVWGVNGAVSAWFVEGYLFGGGNVRRWVGGGGRGEREEYFKSHDAFMGKAETDEEEDAAKVWLEEYALGQCERAAASEKADEEKGQAVVYNQLRARGIVGKDLVSELLDHMLAGTDTPRVALTYLQWELSQRLDVQTQLRNELRSSLPSSSSSLTPTPDLLKTLDALPLLDAILTETLRLHTPTPGPQYRITPPEGATIHGFYIPPHTSIHASFAILHRNPDVFPEPEAWKPERWVNANKEQLDEMGRWFWGFNKGSRTCIAKDFSILAMKLVIATIYSRYETSIIDDERMAETEETYGQVEGDKLVLKFSVAA